MLTLFLLMYADDMVLFAESPESLQRLFNTLHTYNNKWKLTLNVDKKNDGPQKWGQSKRQ
jgi:hypothetical protein